MRCRCGLGVGLPGVSIADRNSCVRPRRWLRAMGVEGVVVASQKLGAPDG
jgi:hypothetical protein